MASVFDWVSLVIVGAIFLGVVYGVMKATEGISKAVTNTKEQLKTKGYTISDSGVSIKTSGRYDREDYVDSQRRGFIAAMGASSFGAANSTEKQPVVSRQTSLASVDSLDSPVAENDSTSTNHTDGVEKKRSRFSLRKSSRN